MTNTRTHYAFGIKLDVPYEQAIQRVTEALKEEDECDNIEQSIEGGLAR